MVTRRQVLKGTAAGSIAAIASAHGVKASAESIAGEGAGYGSLEGGALGSFQKQPNGYSVFFKFYKSAAEVFYKVNDSAGIDVFFKFFQKRWSSLTPIQSLADVNLQGADAGFFKLQTDGAGFFIKFADGSPAHYLAVSADGQYGFEGPNCIEID